MLIWVDPSVLTADLAEDHDACRGISAIFDAVFRGEHYALGARATLSALAANPNLSSATRTTIATVQANFSLLGGIAAQVSARVQVTHGMAETCMRTSQTVWEIPLKEIGVHGVKKAVLLTENLYDAKAYEHAAKQYQVSLGMRSQVALERAGGGGSTTPESFKNYTATENRWCLCITDSDRICPSDNMDVTAQKCNEIAKNEAIVASHIDLPAREVENILPIAFLAEAIPPTHQERWDWHIEKLCKLRFDAHHYCDIKKGTTFRQIHFYAAQTPRKIYWTSVTTDLKNAAALTSECIAANECEQEDPAACHCYVAHGFGGKVLESVVNYLDSRTAHQSEKLTRHDLNRAPWLDIGRSVFEWACAPAKTRV